MMEWTSTLPIKMSCSPIQLGTQGGGATTPLRVGHVGLEAEWATTEGKMDVDHDLKAERREMEWEDTQQEEAQTVQHQGHSFSNGLQAHIVDIHHVLYDCEADFAPFHADYLSPLPCFLYGESLGGTIMLLLHLRDKDRWPDGAAKRFIFLDGGRVDPHFTAHFLSSY
ncbi:phospholipase-like protein [Hordeum vulgare]|nr:phospholipase-like protein [Hordeum vulgare]